MCEWVWFCVCSESIRWRSIRMWVWNARFTVGVWVMRLVAQHINNSAVEPSRCLRCHFAGNRILSGPLGTATRLDVQHLAATRIRPFDGIEMVAVKRDRCNVVVRHNLNTQYLFVIYFHEMCINTQIIPQKWCPDSHSRRSTQTDSKCLYCQLDGARLVVRLVPIVHWFDPTSSTQKS